MAKKWLATFQPKKDVKSFEEIFLGGGVGWGVE